MKDKLEIIKVSKTYEDRQALKEVSFNVKNGEFLSILGPSGCGKTTLLRILIGIESLDSGTIRKDGTDITDALPARRGMGIVFQNYALFPNKSVLNNVKYALTLKKDTKEKSEEIAKDIIAKVGLTEYADKMPKDLSGGQQQRVAIARTLALKPEIILFDEPMSALDAAIRLNLRKELKSIQDEFKVTMIYITHDQEEAFAMSDRIMVMNKGIIEQIDTPVNIYNNPKNEYVRSFVTEHLKEKVASIEANTVKKNGK